MFVKLKTDLSNFVGQSQFCNPWSGGCVWSIQWLNNQNLVLPSSGPAELCFHSHCSYYWHLLRFFGEWFNISLVFDGIKWRFVQLNLNTKIGLPTTQTLRQQYLSCYWPDLDQTLNKGSWEHIQQITTVTTTFVQATFVLGTFVHISNISISKLNTFDFSLIGTNISDYWCSMMCFTITIFAS